MQNGQVTQEVAQANRLEIVDRLSSGECVISGEVVTDQQINLQSNQVLRGENNASIENRFGSANGINNTVTIQNPSGVGYADFMAQTDYGVVLQGADYDNYPEGGRCFSYIFDGYTLPVGQQHRAHKIVEVRHRTLRLKPDPHPQANRLAYFTPSDGTGWARFTPGPAVANELFGETRFLRGGWHDKPLLRGYHNPQFCKLTPTENIRIENITIKQPVHPGANPFFAEWAVGLRLNNVTFEGNCGIALSAGVQLNRCDVHGELGLNAVEDSTFRRLFCRDLYMEEGCLDLRFSQLDIAGSPANGIYTTTNCDLLHFDDFTVSGVTVYPIAVGGRGMRFTNGRLFRNPQPPDNAAFLSSDGLYVENLVSDTRLVLQGRRIVARSIKAPTTFIGWYNSPADVQDLTGVQNVDWQFSPQ